MTTTPQQRSDREPTLADVIAGLDRVNERIGELPDNVNERINGLSDSVDLYNEKFEVYQQGTRWVVQLAFTLIASETYHSLGFCCVE